MLIEDVLMQMRLRLPCFLVFLLTIVCLFFIQYGSYSTFQVNTDCLLLLIGQAILLC